MNFENGCNESSSDRKSFYSHYNDDIVISGIAGRFPDSNNIRCLQENLFNKVDLVSEDDRRWKLKHPEIPKRAGKINNIEKFDALFFGVHSKQAAAMDPCCRMLLEHAYEAIIDAGINPCQLRGTKTGVFIGACTSECDKEWSSGKTKLNGLGITGCSRTMLANRISYFLNLTGPSYAIDSACSSSLLAMEQAYNAIRSGQCTAALVGGANICILPYMTLEFSHLGVLSPEGRCKAFDVDGNGYVRSETVGMFYLQKASDAKRIYATLVHAKTNCDGFKEEGVLFPSSIIQGELLKECYEECGVSPSSVSYIEAHGTGTKVGDYAEVNAIDKVFCQNRTSPLKIGSSKSNLGHAEAASGIASLAKSIIVMETRLIPPNLHCNRLRNDIEAIKDGRVKVVTEVTPWEGDYIGVNSFGFGGANVHVVLKSIALEKEKNGAPNDNLPRLVVISGRTEEAVNVILKDVESRPIDVEYVRLLQDIHIEDIPGHMYRGYTIVGGSVAKENPIREIQHYPGAKLPIWFVFSGMGSQWPGMGAALLRLPIFAQAVKKCDAVLKPRGIDIYDILSNTSKSNFDNVLNSFVGIAAVQIGLVDLLTHVGIVPDKIIGHSAGELGCAYADGCFTAEQTILAAYSRGLATMEANLIHGSMAAIGLGYTHIKDICPSDIDVACHNGPDSCTISGPVESINAFVAKLQAMKVFAKDVPCNNIPYHSRYIAAVGPKLLDYLRKVIPEPKPRTAKWLSTSVQRYEWNSVKARDSSAEYHTNNLLNPVLLEEILTMIPKNAITIEIAPHALLQAILRRSLSPEVVNIGLTQRNHKDNVEVVLQGLGKLFTMGLQPRVANLFPTVLYPVSRGTPMISPLIKWEHSNDWYVVSHANEKLQSSERIIDVNLNDEKFAYMANHIMDGRNLFPATGYVVLVWETLAMMYNDVYTNISVVFEDIKFLRATNIPKEGTIQFVVTIHRGTGKFEVSEGGAAVVTGSIRSTKNPSEEMVNICCNIDDEIEAMDARDFYKELRLRGIHHSGLFPSVKSSSISGSKGTIAWVNNWVAFIDNMLHIHFQSWDTREVFVPTRIQKLTIDPITHLRLLRDETTKEQLFSCKYDKIIDVIVSGGIEIRGFKLGAISRRKIVGEPILESYGFIAHRDRAETSLKEIVSIAGNIVLENHLNVKIQTIEAVDSKVAPPLEDLVSSLLLEIFDNIPLIEANVTIVASMNPFDDGILPEKIAVTDPQKITAATAAVLVSGRDLFTCRKNETIDQLLPALKEGGFLLTRENGNTADISAAGMKCGLDIILEKRIKNETVLLFKKRINILKKSVIVNVGSNNFDWISQLNSELKSNDFNRILLVSEKDFENGLLGLVNCLRKEPGGENIRGYLIQDKKAPDFSEGNPLYASQLKLDLAINVLRTNGTWGTYRHLQLPKLIEKPVYHAWATQVVHGDLSSFRWFEGALQPSSDHRNLVRVTYSAVNFRDVMLATGKLAIDIITKQRQMQECPFGLEYSGVDSSGRRIMGLVQLRGFTNIVTVDKNLSWIVPDSWSLEDAATVPCVYATSLYALYFSGKMKKGDKVLIHAGSGGIGQASITMALHEGCEVFTTVGTPEKRRFIKEQFPEIADDHIGNSRDTSFEQMIIQQTNGLGVDIVLNSLAEEKLQASVRCLAHGGRFLEIGKFDLAANNTIGMEPFLKEISFHGIMLDNLMIASESKKMELQKMMQFHINSGAVKPLTRIVFPINELESALRYMAAGKHIGKVLIHIQDESKNRLNSMIKALPRFNCQEDGSYVIHGGLGGFGLELADWLVIRGTKNLVLTSRTGIKNGYELKRIELWKSYGVKVVVIEGKDASIRQDCEDILTTAENLGPVIAIFNLAVALKDAIMENQTKESYEVSFKCKAWSTKQLDEVSRKLCPKLQHFVVFSSVSCGRGNAGQTNYGMSNSVMERICEKRVAEGLPGLAVQWGPVGEVGLLAENQEEDKNRAIIGLLPQTISSCLVELDKFLKQGSPIVSSILVADKKASEPHSLNLVDRILNIMGMKELKNVSEHSTLAELGMDSMMVTEINQTLERDFEIFLRPKDVRGLTFSKILNMSAKTNEEKQCTESNDQYLNAMKHLIRVIDGRKLKQELCVKLQTKEEVGRDEVFLIPDIGGYNTAFENLATNIRSPATCLQLLSSSDDKNTIDKIAQQFVPHILKRNRDRKNFVIAGYSFGSLVAIELARKLEAEGLNGRLVLIDGSPEYTIALKRQQISVVNDDELENKLLSTIMNVLDPSITLKLINALNTCSSWAERWKAFITRSPAHGVLTDEEKRQFWTTHLQRLKAIEKYDYAVRPPLRSSIILLKTAVPVVKDISFDYGLSAMTRGNVEVYTVEGDHFSILDSPKTAAAINGESLEDSTTATT